MAGVGVLVEVGRLLRVTSNRRAPPAPVLDFVLVGVGGLVAVTTIATSPLTGPWTPELGVYLTLLGSPLVSFGGTVSLRHETRR